ncbi:hypothetical protein bthur0004_29200 [Bacillus thuringiensis serovar sotto str. T04001]|nr:hypothetical protein bthur0004_29200 [Bacillus thuringiensis serovar sotto str. T04001]
MKKSSIIVFLLTYGLFYVSSVLFPINRTWYDALEKPSWTPPGMTIGMIWAVLFGLIALSVAIIYNNYGFKPKTFWFVFLLNYIFNQAFSYFQFSQKKFVFSNSRLFTSRYYYVTSHYVFFQFI